MKPPEQSINSADPNPPTSLPKVFVIGHNKAGTRSIHKLFKINNYKSLHWEKGKVARIIRSNLNSTLPLLSGIDGYHCYSDMELNGVFYAYTLFPQIDLQYANSIFIYNKRNVDEWIASRLKHGKYISVYKERFNSRAKGKLASENEVINHWKDFFWRHEEMIYGYFRNKDNLITLDLGSKESEDLLLCRLINSGFKFDKSCELPHAGKSK